MGDATILNREGPIVDQGCRHDEGGGGEGIGQRVKKLRCWELTWSSAACNLIIEWFVTQPKMYKFNNQTSNFGANMGIKKVANN